MLRWAFVAVAAFFFVVAVFFSQLDYIAMFWQITAAVWLGGGGTSMVFGLYSRFGNKTGAWGSIIFGCGFSLAGFVLQYTWAARVVPWLSSLGWTVCSWPAPGEPRPHHLARTVDPAAFFRHWFSALR